MKKFILIALLVVICFVVVSCLLADDDSGTQLNTETEINESYYQKAKAALEAGSWKEANQYLSKLPEGYNDPDNLKTEAAYQTGVALFEEYNYNMAKQEFSLIPDYKDVSDYLSNVEFGLVDNTYKYELVTGSGSATQVTSYSMIFEHGYCHHITSYFPEMYYAGNNPMSGSSSFVYKIEGDLMYTYVHDYSIDPPEDLNDWSEPNPFTNVIWEGDKIVSYTYNGIDYTIEQ